MLLTKRGLRQQAFAICVASLWRQGQAEVAKGFWLDLPLSPFLSNHIQKPSKLRKLRMGRRRAVSDVKQCISRFARPSRPLLDQRCFFHGFTLQQRGAVVPKHP
jgi:hypothetical protein